MSNEDTNNLETELKKAHEKIQIIQSVSTELNKVMSLRDKLQSILEILYTKFGLKHAMILLPDENSERLTVFASKGYSEKIAGQSITFGQGLIGQVARTKRKLNISGLQRKRRFMEITQQSSGEDSFLLTPGLPNADSQVAIPLLSNEELVAVLMAESPNVLVFSLEDSEFLTMLTQPMAISIQNSMLFDNMEEKIRVRTSELRRLTETKERFFSIISHDLRSPLSSFQAIAKLLRYYNSKNDTFQIDELCSRVDISVRKLNHLLDNLLDWSLQNTNGIICHFEDISLQKLMYEVLEVYKESIFAKTIKLRVQIAPEIMIHGDFRTLATVFRNLISNAIKFTPRNGDIFIAGDRINDFAEITIMDNGVGIPNERIDSLFELMESKTTQGTEKEKGTGLGLILVREFIMMNKGKIAVKSAEGNGAQFIISLPLGSQLR